MNPSTGPKMDLLPFTCDALRGAFAAALRGFVADQGVSVVGGCCGTTPEHIRALGEALRAVLRRTHLDNAMTVDALTGKRLVETLSGDADRGGCQLSRCFCKFVIGMFDI